jgi:LPS-assembly lipoprotein
MSQAGLASLALGGCGFRLRGSQNFVFTRIAIMPDPGGAVAAELRRSFGAGVRVLAPDEPLDNAQLVLDILQEQREKTVVGISSSGQVREFQLRIRVKFKIRTPQGRELLPESEIVQQRDISFNESAVLAKEAEESLLYRDMQADVVQQLMRRLAAVKQL